MSTITRVTDAEKDPRVKAVFNDIRKTRGNNFINNLWHYLAFDPKLLEEVWNDVKDVMATPSELDPLVKEMIYMAVSIANSCSYCIHSHTAAARAKGMTDSMYAEVLRIIALAAKTNHLANGLQLPIDPVFDTENG